MGHPLGGCVGAMGRAKGVVHIQLTESGKFFGKAGLIVRFLGVVSNGVRKGDGEMKKELAVKRNLDLLNEFMKYAFENPEVMDKIPPEAELVILPVDDQKLSDSNKKMADKL